MRDALPGRQVEWVEGWGRAAGAAGYVYRPTNVGQIREVLELARSRGVPVVLRGAGRSYGDAALLAEAVVLDLSEMNRILGWDASNGVAQVEPGVTFHDLWRSVLADGWWPEVVTGTMTPTLGGGLAMNVHGKNNWTRGTLGEHCLELTMLLPSGELRTVTPETDGELFHAVIGGFGQLGVIVGARVRLKRVHSGRLEVHAVAAQDLATMLRLADDAKNRWEYVVGWIDAFASGGRSGRGLLHFANHVKADEDPAAQESLRAEAQDLPARLAGVVPKALLWRFLKPLTNRPGMRLINAVKFRLGSTIGNDKRYRQTLAEFSFLLDYVPNWERVYLPGGLIQHQSFVPVAEAEGVFARQLELCRRAGLPSFLAVLKRHRPDPFLLTHAVDGFSLALDFPVTASNRDRLWRLVADLAEPVVEAGGRFYPAKDAALPGELYRATFRDGQLERFAAIKERTDPGRLLRSALADRLLLP
jgi:FAD/FMN-containing dehydrogenase